MKRHNHIDMLRGFSMTMIMLTHATSYFLANNAASTLWNLSQFSVAVFIFCSFYLFFKKPAEDASTYLKKRFYRLYIPYLVFLVFFLPLKILFDKPPMTILDVIRYTTLTTRGNDLSWLVLLFFQLTLVGVVIKKLEKNKFLFFSFFFLSLLSALAFHFKFLNLNFKLLMWLPWSLIIFFTWAFVKLEDKPDFLRKATLFSGLVFTWIYIFNVFFVQRLSFYDNKYPPNLYHLSYGIFWICLLMVLAKKGIFDVPIIKPLLNYLSRYSYPLYFIHFFILHYLLLLQRPFLNSLNWWGLFGVLLFGALSLHWSMHKLMSRR